MKRTSKTLLMGLALGVILSGPASAEIKPEKLTIERLRPATPHRLYLTDVALQHVIDGRVHIIDGESFDYLGLIGTGMFGVTALSPDSSEMYVATTYYTKRNRGKRFDQFEAYSTEDLSLKAEIEIPAKHAQALAYKGTIIGSSDSRFVFIQNSTPASSVTVVDRKAEKFVTEIDTPGCWIVLPAPATPSRFSTLCGDGTILTVSLKENGEPGTQKRSAKLFDADKDPLFVQAETIGDTTYFVSFQGNIFEMNLNGEVAQLKKTWSLLDDKDKAAHWAPGGYQLMTVHEPSKTMYIGMHEGAHEGTHKWPAKEIWKIDLAKRQRVERAPGGNAIAMTITKEDAPHLYVYDGMQANFHKYQTTPALKAIEQSPPFGEFAGLVEAH